MTSVIQRGGDAVDIGRTVSALTAAAPIIHINRLSSNLSRPTGTSCLTKWAYIILPLITQVERKTMDQACKRRWTDLFQEPDRLHQN
jgi:hypothetical protein